jgi:hypothetical protein
MNRHKKFARNIVEGIYDSDDVEPGSTPEQIVESWQDKIEMQGGFLWFANELQFRLRTKGYRHPRIDWEEVASLADQIFDREALSRAKRIAAAT